MEYFDQLIDSCFLQKGFIVTENGIKKFYDNCTSLINSWTLRFRQSVIRYV